MTVFLRSPSAGYCLRSDNSLLPVVRNGFCAHIPTSVVIPGVHAFVESFFSDLRSVLISESCADLELEFIEVDLGVVGLVSRVVHTAVPSSRTGAQMVQVNGGFN